MTKKQFLMKAELAYNEYAKAHKFEPTFFTILLSRPSGEKTRIGAFSEGMFSEKSLDQTYEYLAGHLQEVAKRNPPMSLNN